MPRLASLLALIALPPLLVTCASSNNLARGPNSGPQGSISGTIALPLRATADDVCRKLKVSAIDREGRHLGEGSVTTGKDRCLYTMNYVRAGIPVTVHLASTGVKSCPMGSVTSRVKPEEITLLAYQSKVLDLTTRCG